MLIDYVLKMHGVTGRKKDLAPPEPSIKRVFGVKITTATMQPSASVSYIDDALGFTQAKSILSTGEFSYGSWENVYPFSEIKPCVLKNGVVQYYLDKNNYALKSDGTPSNLSGVDGDVMVEFPKIYTSITKESEDVIVRFSDVKVDNTFQCHAHMRNGVEKDFLYISAYEASANDVVISSVNNVVPLNNKEIGIYSALARSNGDGYNQMTFYPLVMLQVLYLVMFKDRSSQNALGRGNCESVYTARTGTMNDKGMFYGTISNAVGVKFCGIEHWYGNLSTFIDGVYMTSTRRLSVGTSDYNDEGIGYTDYGTWGSRDISGNLMNVQGNNELGFLPKSVTVNTASYYADGVGLSANSVMRFGGNRTDVLLAGAFNQMCTTRANITSIFTGSRLTYC